MTAMHRMQQVSKRWWFIATYRWSVVALVPGLAAIFVWMLATVNGSQSAIATLDTKVSTVIQRVDSLENANNNALAERLQDTKSNASLTSNISSRLSALETNNENLTKAVDRLVRLLDERLPAPSRRAP